MDPLKGLYDPATVLGALLYATLLLFAAIFAARALRRFVARLIASADNLPIDRTTIVFFSQLGQALIYLGALALFTSMVPPLHRLGTTLLAGVSIASVVLGLAAQSTLGNLIAGFALLLYRPVRIGDRVQVGAPAGPVTGTVEALNLGYTFIRTESGARVIVPNSTMANQVTLNLNDVRATPSDPAR